MVWERQPPRWPRCSGGRGGPQRSRSLLLDGAAVLCSGVIVELWMGVGSKKNQDDLVDLSAVLR